MSRKKSAKSSFLILLLIAALSIITVAYFKGIPPEKLFDHDAWFGPRLTPEVTGGELMKVHFINVGQGDSIFIELSDGKTMLIDAGESKYGDTVSKYIKKLGHSSIDYFVLTHPHSDHIGGAKKVIESIDVKSIWMPDVEHTSKTYINLLELIDEKDINFNIAKKGDVIAAGVTVLSPQKGDDWDNLNNWSIVLLAEFGKCKFLFMGDAEKEIEARLDVGKVNVLKVGHHGSSTSTSKKFISKINPEYAVLCLEQGNSYNHPHKETLETLKNIKTYRTDINGTVICTTNGENVQFKTEKDKAA